MVGQKLNPMVPTSRHRRNSIVLKNVEMTLSLIITKLYSNNTNVMNFGILSSNYNYSTKINISTSDNKRTPNTGTINLRPHIT